MHCHLILGHDKLVFLFRKKVNPVTSLCHNSERTNGTLCFLGHRVEKFSVMCYQVIFQLLMCYYV